MASAVIRSQGRVSRLLREELRADADDRRGPRTRRDWLVDSTLFSVALIVGFAAFSTQVRTGDWPAWAIAAGALGGLAACGALWFRTRWPVALTVAVLPIAVVSSFAGPAGLILFFTVAVHRRFAVVAWIGAIGVPALAASAILQPLPRTGGQPSLRLTLLLLVLVHVTVAACGMYIRARRLL